MDRDRLANFQVDMSVDLGRRQSGGRISSGISIISAFTDESCHSLRRTDFRSKNKCNKNVPSQKQMSVISPLPTPHDKGGGGGGMMAPLTGLTVVLLLVSGLLASPTNAEDAVSAKCDGFNGNNSVPGVWCDFEGPCPWKWDIPKAGEAGFRRMSAAQVVTKMKKQGEWAFRGPMKDSQNKTDGKHVRLLIIQTICMIGMYHSHADPCNFLHMHVKEVWRK